MPRTVLRAGCSPTAPFAYAVVTDRHIGDSRR